MTDHPRSQRDQLGDRLATVVLCPGCLRLRPLHWIARALGMCDYADQARRWRQYQRFERRNPPTIAPRRQP